uniref:Immunoglobulin I-set domain-containing protein n=1 Tax=Strigops habroptila TaxID=2489341 RepID=A0A672U5B0_STRHB
MKTFWVITMATEHESGCCWRHIDRLIVLPFTGSVTNWFYVAVNESALLSIAAAGSVYDVTWVKDRKRLLQLKDRKVKYYVNKEQCRCKIFLNGTLHIEQVVKEDSGQYTVTVYEQDGKLKAEEHTMFIVQGEFLLFPYKSHHS